MSATAKSLMPVLGRGLGDLTRSRRRVWTGWRLVRILGLLSLVLVPGSADDLSLYAHWAALLQQGDLPFRDFNLEYPPGVLPLLLLPAPSEAVFRVCFVGLALVVDAHVLRQLLMSARRGGAAAWVVAPLLLGPVFWARLDVFVAWLLVCCVEQARRGRWPLAATAAVGAGALKLWPLVLAILLLAIAPRESRAAAARWAGAAVGLLLLPVLAWGGGSGLLWMLRYHQQRGVEVEALSAVPLHVGRMLGHHLEIVRGHGAIEFSAAASRVPGLIATALLVAGLLLTVWLVGRGRLREPGQLTLLIVLVIVVTSKVLSAQYMVWLAAAVALTVDDLPRPGEVRMLGLSTAAALLSTQYLWPIGLPALVSGQAVGYVAMGIHALAVVAFAVTVALVLAPELRSR